MTSSQVEIYKLVQQVIDLQEQLEEQRKSIEQVVPLNCFQKCSPIETECPNCPELREEVKELKEECERLNQYNAESNRALFELQNQIKTEKSSRSRENGQSKEYYEVQEKYQRLQTRYAMMEYQHNLRIADIRKLEELKATMSREIEQLKQNILSLQQVNKQMTRQDVYDRRIQDLIKEIQTEKQNVAAQEGEIQSLKQIAHMHEADFKKERERCNQLHQQMENQEQRILEDVARKNMQLQNNVNNQRAALRRINTITKDINRVGREMQQRINDLDKNIYYNIGAAIPKIQTFAEAIRSELNRFI